VLPRKSDKAIGMAAFYLRFARKHAHQPAVLEQLASSVKSCETEAAGLPKGTMSTEEQVAAANSLSGFYPPEVKHLLKSFVLQGAKLQVGSGTVAALFFTPDARAILECFKDGSGWGRGSSDGSISEGPVYMHEHLLADYNGG
jgi:hypothetical protein